jgi:TFIIF-interacting CTD phosphatase-like protein
MSKICELVVFSSFGQEYTDPIINFIDKDNLVSYRRFQDHIWGVEEKRIDLLGRDIKRTIIVDQSELAFLSNPSYFLNNNIISIDYMMVKIRQWYTLQTL